ncbi:unnamed protein product [Ceutorhynchus assimilis]|uniref:Farnesol dehydrogenase-like n=1 Tax=Ceutorhynchus assimilis TaxID=467358 RepID=A0A9N9QM86_9CUCU|nr:unnamed protein product [Ceutorhynchus assimilis]
MSCSLSLKTFVGKVAIVTGTSAGIGKAIAETLVKHGVIVAGLARRVERVEEHSKQLGNESGKLHAFRCDITNQEEIISTVKEITEKLGPIDILVNNAGLARATNIIDGDVEKWKSVLDTNLLAVAIFIKEVIANMKLHKTKGHIININSILGHWVVDMPLINIYPASKHAITALTETVRLEINREKLPIKITSLSPGYVKTEIIASEEFAKEAIPQSVEIHKGLESQDIADAALYILSTPDHVNVNELTVVVQGRPY